MSRHIDPAYSPVPTDVLLRCRIQSKAELLLHEHMNGLLEQAFGGTNALRHNPIAFDLNQEELHCQIALPVHLFEKGNLAQHLEVLKSLKSDEEQQVLEILDISWPNELLQHFAKPQHSLQELRQQYGISERPLSAAEILPQAGLNSRQIVERAYHLWMGGCDIVLESRLSISDNEEAFKDRVQTLKNEQKNCSERSKKLKAIVCNINASTLEQSLNRAEVVKQSGIDHVSISSESIGLAGLRSLSERCHQLGLTLWGYRSELSTAQLHIHAKASAEILQYSGLSVIQSPTRDQQAFINAVSKQGIPLCLSSSPRTVEELIKEHGADLLIQGGRWIYEHPDGLKSGAEALQAAIEAAANGIDQQVAADKNDSLLKALGDN